jgi:SAM-dependent methyltransferase
MIDKTQVLDHNRVAWNQQSRGASRWCEAVDGDVIAAAQQGQWEVILTPTKMVPRSWFGALLNKDVLCLASGGGQQAPVLAAAGARVVSFDNSDEQLAKDLAVARQHNLNLVIEQGDMADLSRFADASFDLVFQPVANVFIPDVVPVWRECYRLLRPGGVLLAGFMNPAFYLFDHEAPTPREVLQVRFAQPYSDLLSRESVDLDKKARAGEALEFGHSLEHQLGGQIDAGFVLSGFYEDHWDNAATPLNQYMPTSMATRASKPLPASA